MTSSETIRLAQALKTAQAIEEFLTFDMEAMRQRVPSLSWTRTYRSHSYGRCSSHTPGWLIPPGSSPARIEDECAAFCSMIGCEATGCGMTRYDPMSGK